MFRYKILKVSNSVDGKQVFKFSYLYQIICIVVFVFRNSILLAKISDLSIEDFNLLLQVLSSNFFDLLDNTNVSDVLKSWIL